MSTLELSRFREINAIIERDSKDTTYEFALLRAVIDLSQEYAHLKQDRRRAGPEPDADALG